MAYRRLAVDYGVQEKARKLSIGLFVVSLGMLLGSLYTPALKKMRSLEGEVETKRKALRDQKELRQRYEEELHAMRHDPEAIERAVREKMRLILPGETIYRFESPPAPQR